MHMSACTHTCIHTYYIHRLVFFRVWHIRIFLARFDCFWIALNDQVFHAAYGMTSHCNYPDELAKEGEWETQIQREGEREREAADKSLAMNISVFRLCFWDATKMYVCATHANARLAVASAFGIANMWMKTSEIWPRLCWGCGNSFAR